MEDEKSIYALNNCFIVMLIETEIGLYHMLKALNEVGVVVLKDSSTEDLTVLKCAERISYIRETMYGRHFDVMSKPSSNNIAYTSRELPLHQDLW